MHAHYIIMHAALPLEHSPLSSAAKVDFDSSEEHSISRISPSHLYHNKPTKMGLRCGTTLLSDVLYRSKGSLKAEAPCTQSVLNFDPLKNYVMHESM